MIPPSDLAPYRAQTQQVATLAKTQQKQFFYSLDLTKPEAARDALLVFTPSLVETFAPVAASLAATFYETVRRQQTARDYTAFLLYDEKIQDRTTGMVRYAAGNLFTDNPGKTLDVMDGAVQRYVTNSARSTIAGNVSRDPLKPRYARVPSGKCCAWCSALASRGFVYKSAATAGQVDRFHDDDECAIVPDWSHDPGVDGYDPDHLYSQYLSARSASGSPNLNDIVAEMRRQHPDSFTDGVVSAN